LIDDGFPVTVKSPLTGRSGKRHRSLVLGELACANGRDDEQVTGSRGGHVRDADAFFAVLLFFLLLVVQQVPWSAVGHLLCAKPALGIDESVCVTGQPGRQVREDDHGPLQPFGFVDGHQLHAVGFLLENRSVGRFPSCGLLLEVQHERPERCRMPEFERARHFYQALCVCGNAAATPSKAEGGESTRMLE
jgi:hypothetical protein